MYAKRIDSPGKIDLGKIPTRERDGLEKDEAEARLATLCEELEELQELLYAANQHSLLVVFQGRDTSGKDGVINRVIGAMDVVGCRIESFKTPTPLELAHDFLWRVHQKAPARGEVVVFNRSHYEDVLIVRVRGLAPEPVWSRRYADINHFEELLHASGTIIVKFCLHISKEEQEERLRAREEEPEKAWKLNPADWEERPYWEDYTAAYEDAIGQCAHPHAPWYVVPADYKWFRNLAVAEALVETLRPYRDDWRRKLDRIGETQRKALDAVRPAKG